MIRKDAWLRCLLAIGVLLLAVRTGRTQPAPSWLVQGQGATVFHLVASPTGTVSIIGAGAFSREGIILGDVTLMGDDSTSALIATYAADGTFLWGRPGAFRADQDGFFSVGKLILGFEGAVDALGNLYTSEGYSFALDSGMLASGGVSINKYASDGAHRWTVPIHPPVAHPDDQPGYVHGLGLDQAGNVYAAGIYRDTLLLAPDTLVAFPLEAPRFVGDVFLVSYTPEGTLRWSRRIGGPRYDSIGGGDPRGAFTVDRDGNTYLGGSFGQGAVFGEGQPTEVTLARDAYALTSFDAEGQLRWVRTERDLGISDNAIPWRLAVDAAGNLFVDWSVDGNTVTVGDWTFIDPGSGGEFLTKFAPDGALLWARQLKGDGNEIISDLTTDAQGHLYVSGSFDGSYLILEHRVLRKDLQADKTDGFVAHYDAEGRLRWAGHAAGVGTQRINAIATSPSGDLYVAGEFEETLHLGPATLEAVSGLDLFVAKYDAATITAKETVAEVPNDVVLKPNYPNPFTLVTTIEYVLPAAARVTLKVYDVLGREVATLVDGIQGAGRQEAVFEGTHLPSGTYLYRLEASGQVRTGALLLLK